MDTLSTYICAVAIKSSVHVIVASGCRKLELGGEVKNCVVFNWARFSCIYIMFSTVTFTAVSFTGVRL